MSRRRIILLIVVIALIAAAALAATVVARRDSTLEPPAPVAERQMRAGVTKYQALWEPVRPAKFYGKQLTPVRCVSLMKGRDAQLDEVADGEAYESARSSWSTLSGLIRQEQGLTRQFGDGTVPTSCTGEVGYWEVRSGGGERYVVRAAVLETLSYGRWDAAAGALTGKGSISYDEASAYDYTLQKADGVWKVIEVRGTGLTFTRGGSGLHPDSA
jgi:hypothetical protein